MKISNNHISKNRNINDINMMEQIQGNELKKNPYYRYSTFAHKFH